MEGPAAYSVEGDLLWSEKQSIPQ